MAAQVDTPLKLIDERLQKLDAHKQEWADLDIGDRIVLLQEVQALAAEHSERWAMAAIEAKQLESTSPLAGEEWSSGPWAMLYGVDHLLRTLTAFKRGDDPLAGLPIRTRDDGRVVVRVHPADTFDKLLLNGCEGEVWMQDDVTEANLRQNIGAFYQTASPKGQVAVVLGAGNISSIAPLDLLFKLFAEGQVSVLKMNPVNDYLGPIFQDIFMPLVTRGFVAFAYGGIEVGKHLTYHDLVGEIHITGSERTFNAIVYGTGDDAEERRKNDDALNARRVTSELGGVGPVIVVPGPWSPSDLSFQAEHVATMKLHNGGFNCVAAQVLILSEGWEHTPTFVDLITSTIRAVEEREPYYPGAVSRVDSANDAHDDWTQLGESRTFITGIPHDDEAVAFKDEFFCSALAQTSLPETDPEAFLRAAVKFANERLFGTLGANILIHPATLKELGPKFEEIIADLEYGTIGVNAWVGMAYLMARVAWGAHPGHTRGNIGSGQGIVHNALLFDKPLKSIVRAPFREFPASMLNGEFTLLPRPPWFVTNTMAHEVMRRLALFAAKPAWKHVPGIFGAALRG